MHKCRQETRLDAEGRTPSRGADNTTLFSRSATRPHYFPAWRCGQAMLADIVNKEGAQHRMSTHHTRDDLVSSTIIYLYISRAARTARERTDIRKTQTHRDEPKGKHLCVTIAPRGRGHHLSRPMTSRGGPHPLILMSDHAGATAPAWKGLSRKPSQAASGGDHETHSSFPEVRQRIPAFFQRMRLPSQHTLELYPSPLAPMNNHKPTRVATATKAGSNLLHGSDKRKRSCGEDGKT